MDIESPMNSPIKKSPANAFQHSDLGRISNVEEVINVLKSDEEEYQQLIKVIQHSISSHCFNRKKRRK